MPVFIAYDERSRVESVVIAKNLELANAFWQGKNVSAFSINSFEESFLDDHPTGVAEIVKTKLIFTDRIRGISQRVV